MSSFATLFSMGKYTVYVYLSYGAVLTFLLWQWFLPWRRWQHFYKTRHNSHE